jgi:hypothetical protein
MIETFLPLLRAASGLDLSAPGTAVASLDARLDPAGEEADAVRAALLALLEEGRIADRGEAPLKYGRAARAGEETLGFSIDVVHMSGSGPRHRHPNGEVNFCVPLEGTPAFEGQRSGWVVMPPGSTHVPRVEGGTMLIVYLLPEGKIEFLEG